MQKYQIVESYSKTTLEIFIDIVKKINNREYILKRSVIIPDNTHIKYEHECILFYFSNGIYIDIENYKYSDRTIFGYVVTFIERINKDLSTDLIILNKIKEIKINMVDLTENKIQLTINKLKSVFSMSYCNKLLDEQPNIIIECMSSN